MSNTDLTTDKGTENNMQQECDEESCDSSIEMDQNDQMDTDQLDTTPCRNDPELRPLQKVDIFMQQLPYYEQTKKCAFDTFEIIRKNLADSIALNEFRPGFAHWSNQLIVYIHEYGLFFTKKDHLKLIELYLATMLNDKIDLPSIDYCLSVLTELLKKFDKITRDELQIEWRPLYNLFLHINKLNDYSAELPPSSIESNAFANFIRYARIYFNNESTKEMLEEWRTYMCPFDSAMNSVFEIYKLFLPTIMYEHELEYGYKLWLKEFLNLWTTFSTRNFWESHLVSLFARVASDNIGEIDWSPYIPYIFSNTLRGFGLPFGSKDSIAIGLSTTASAFNSTLSQIFVYGNDDVSTISTWIISMIGTGSNRDLCMEHIKKLFLALRSFYYPSNTGTWSANLFLFLKSLPENLIKRIKKEKSESKKWYHKPSAKNYAITDSDVENFVLALKEVCFMAIFSKSNQADARKAFQYLTFLRSDLIMEPFLDKVYQSFDSLIEPHRYTSILNCLVSVSRELATYNPRQRVQTQIHLITLLNSVLPGLDPNDSNKCYLTLSFLASVLNCIIVCDCSPAVNYRSDLTEHEKELCYETTKFEDFVHEFFKRVFYITDQLASDTSAESSASAAAASKSFTYSSRNKNNDDNYYQAHMIHTIKILIRQSSKDILKIIFNKIRNYINSNNFNARSGRILSATCGYLACTNNFGDFAFESFFNQVYENLSRFKEGKNYELFLKDERGDIEVEWNLQLLTELSRVNGVILVKHMSRMKQIISWYRAAVNKEITSYLCSLLRNIVVSLSTIYPLEQSSVDYNFVYDDESQFFKNYLPIRDWAKNGDIFNLGLKYHIPSVEELETCLDFVNENLTQSFSFLTRTINDMSLTSKEERNRELNFVNHLMYASSRLLKRAVKYSHLTEHINSQVQIGHLDDLNKGLGFEINYLNDSNHEYSKLSEHHKNLILNLREYCVNYLIDLAETLIKTNSNETLLMQFISRILSTASITYGFFVSDFEKLWKTHHTNKTSLQNKLLGKKNTLRSELITRVMLQYQYRTFYIHTRVNQLDLKIINILFRLSVDSVYATVRKDAQTQLFSLLSHYSYSNLILVPKLVDMLNKCNLTDENKLTHDQLKGCLYVLSGNNYQDSLMIKQNWYVLSQIWPVLLRCQNYDKPSIQSQLDKIYLRLDKDFDSFENRFKLNDKIVQLAFDLSPQTKLNFNNQKRLDVFNIKSLQDNHMISDLMTNLIQISRESTLNWKNQSTSYGSIMYLLYSCQNDPNLLTPECVDLFVDSLIHENIHVRKLAVDALCIIFKMIKYPREKIEYNTEDLIQNKSVKINTFSPGYRSDNCWHLYNENFLNDFKWSETKFLDKSYWGYYCWPTKIKINSNKRRHYESIVEQDFKFCHVYKTIWDKFTNENFFAKFLQLFKIEESKGNEKFDKKIFYLFKSLFRNFGSKDIIPNVYTHLRDLISDKETATQERSHKLAAEITSGLMRGSKYWSYDKLCELWSQMEKIFNLLMDNVSSDNLSLWKSCFSNSYEDQDPRRLTFYMNYFKNLALRILPKNSNFGSMDESSSATSFQQTSCLQFLIAFSQLEWRAPDFWSSLIDLLLNNMNHPYKTVREKVGYCLTLSHVTDVDYSVSIDNGFITSNKDEFQMKNMKKFIDYLELQLNKSIELFDSVSETQDDSQVKETKITDYKSPQHQSSINFLQTIFSWFSYYIYKSYQPINKEIIRLIPQLCSVDKIAAQELTIKTQLPMIRIAISMWIMDKQSSKEFLEQLSRIVKMKSWMSRLAAIQMIQNFGIFNLFLVDENSKLLIKHLILEALIDEQLEVRVSASLALTGLIHSNFIQVDDDLVSKLKSLSVIKARKKDKESGKMVTNVSNLIKRHGGTLGLCSIVNSCPYDVPSYLPDVVTYLCNFINDPVPIQGSVRKCLSEFRRTHHDNWSEHKLHFDESQLSILMDILISPSYYA
ncbi:unnamed protein product [Brachionus calyciflorus]|uniref:Proteasome activator complex subunit 4 n=1 Tax=Brachionus calyciflorus TaxID=104777 RepID=A0A813QQ80_9BILA|nr:unnamed protein product [Brachionus calyciflorus]